MNLHQFSVSDEPSRFVMTNNVQILAKVTLDIDWVLAQHIQPYRTEDPQLALEEIMILLNEASAVEIAERELAGYTGPRLVK